METVGEYEYNTKDLIGQGAFAIVYKGRSKKNPNMTVAIKSVMKKNLSKSTQLLEKEIKILKELTKLHHVNVVALYDCTETYHHVYLVMEYCNGGDLADYLAEKGTLSEDTIRLFLIQLAGAMQALYAKGVVHRDLKPQNILLSHNNHKSYPQPSEITLKIADFGFARFLQEGNMAATLCGSPMYMAPEVIMSHQYDAKADLWSLGTIVYQCLTGKAAFHANTPQQLKAFYEKNATLAPRIPTGTSKSLSDLLHGLLKRNAKERLNFDEFFKHDFLQRPAAKSQPASVVEPNLSYGTPPSTATPPKPLKPVAKATAAATTTTTTPPPESPKNGRNVLSSSPEDDFVLVPEHLTESYASDKQRTPASNSPQPVVVAAQNNASSSPPRPSYLPVTEPVPVPYQRENYIKMKSKYSSSATSGKDEATSQNNNSIPRSQPINMKRSTNKNQEISINSLSPPSVQFQIGTPPGSGRRRTSSSSLCETPPIPPNFWAVSPVSASKFGSSPLRRSGTSPPFLFAPLTKIPTFGATTTTTTMAAAAAGAFENGNSKRSMLGVRAMTLPEISEMNNYELPLYDVSAFERHTIDFKLEMEAPELEEETLLDREHNETLAKMFFVLDLSSCILEVSKNRGTLIPSLRDKSTGTKAKSREVKGAEQLVLMVKALQLLSGGLALATSRLKTGALKPTSSVKNVVTQLNKKFKATLNACKGLNSTDILNTIQSSGITADKILYEYALSECREAALDELHNSPSECIHKYQTAHILLHNLSQHVQDPKHMQKLKEYQSAVEKRLRILQKHGYVYSTESNIN